MIDSALISSTDDFVPRSLHAEPVRSLCREEARAGWRVYRGRDGFEVALSAQLVNEMLAFGRRAAPREWYALLVGRVCEDSLGVHVVVDAAVLDADARATSGFVETTVESEQRVRHLAALLHPLSIPLGWAHGHHRCGAFYSAQDRRTQATWTQPHSIGVVVDPWSDEPLGVYRGPEAETLTLALATKAAPPVVVQPPCRTEPQQRSSVRVRRVAPVQPQPTTLMARLMTAVCLTSAALAVGTVALSTRVAAVAGRVTSLPVKGRLAEQHSYRALTLEVAELRTTVDDLRVMLRQRLEEARDPATPPTPAEPNNSRRAVRQLLLPVAGPHRPVQAAEAAVAGRATKRPGGS